MSVVGWAGALAPTQAAEERKKLEEKREDRKQLEAIIQGEIAALDEELFARLDVGGKGFLTPDDLKHLATASGEEWDELVIDSMFHAGVCVPAREREIRCLLVKPMGAAAERAGPSL